MKSHYKKTIERYIRSYNEMNVEEMIADLSENVLFEHISGDILELSLKGKEAFRQQAQDALKMFKNRKQTIESWAFKEQEVTVGIKYQATLAVDLPNGMKSGDMLELSGQSVFLFEGDEIKKLTDRS